MPRPKLHPRTRPALAISQQFLQPIDQRGGGGLDIELRFSLESLGFYFTHKFSFTGNVLGVITLRGQIVARSDSYHQEEAAHYKCRHLPEVYLASQQSDLFGRWILPCTERCSGGRSLGMIHNTDGRSGELFCGTDQKRKRHRSIAITGRTP